MCRDLLGSQVPAESGAVQPHLPEQPTATSEPWLKLFMYYLVALPLIKSFDHGAYGTSWQFKQCEASLPSRIREVVRDGGGRSFHLSADTTAPRSHADRSRCLCILSAKPSLDGGEGVQWVQCSLRVQAPALCASRGMPAWRLAVVPTRISPSLEYATTSDMSRPVRSHANLRPHGLQALGVVRSPCQIAPRFSISRSFTSHSWKREDQAAS